MLEYLGEAFIRDNIHHGAFLFGADASIEKLRTSRIIIWGCGLAAGVLTDKLYRKNITPVAYCDNNNGLNGGYFTENLYFLHRRRLKLRMHFLYLQCQEKTWIWLCARF